MIVKRAVSTSCASIIGATTFRRGSLGTVSYTHLDVYKRQAVSSVNSMLVALNQFLVFLEAGTLKVKRLNVQRNLFAIQDKELSKEEYRHLLKAAEEKGKPALSLMIETICSTGIRVSELSYFTVDSIKQGRIQVQNKGKTRIILMPKALKMKLLYFVQKQHITKGCVFVTRTGKPKNRSNIWAEMKALHREAGVDAVKILSLIHI